MRWAKGGVVMGCVAALAVLSLAAVPTAVADPGTQDRSSTPIARANPQVSKALLNSLPASILGSSTIWIDPTIPPGTPFLMASEDGTLSVAEGQPAKQASAAEEILAEGPTAAADSCSTSVVVPIGVSNHIVKSACWAVIGANDNAKVTYTVRKGNTQGTVAWQAEAYKKTKKCPEVKPPLLPDPSKCYNVWNKFWWPGQTNNGSSTVTWGQVAAFPRVKFTNASIVGWAGSFSH